MGSALSDLLKLLSRVDFQYFSNGGGITQAGFWELRSGGHKITI